MPLRRASGHTFSTNSPATRLRSHDVPQYQQHGHQPLLEGPSGFSRPETLLGEQKVVTSIVSRLVNKLPCNSGVRLAVMEVDEGVKTTVQSLLQISRIQLPLVVHALASALETLSKYSSTVSLADAPLDTIHSQLFIIHLLLQCLSESWRLQSTITPSPPSDLPICWPDPPPLDDHLARHLLGVLVVYIRMVSQDSLMGSGTASPVPSKEGKVATTSSGTSWGRQLSPSASSYSLGTKFIQQHSYPPSSTSSSSSSSSSTYGRSKLLSASASTNVSAIHQITKYTSRVVFFVSASNWPLVLSRIKARVAHLTTTIEENPDLVELRLLEWANVDRSRLAQALQEISTPFLHVKRPAQSALSTALRKAIWNWIDVYPAEYQTLIESNRKLEGNPDILFDVLVSMSDHASSTNRRAKVFYPLMVMLLVLSPDMLKRIALGEAGARGTSGFAKKASFMESLRKGLSQSKSFEACAVCYVDLIRAAMCCSPRLDSSGVRSLVPEIQHDLKNALFYSSLSAEIGDTNVLVDGLVALYRSNPSGTSSLIFPKLWSDASDMSKMVAVRACTAIVTEGQRQPWHQHVSGLRAEVASSIRSILKTHASNLGTSPVRRTRGGQDLPSAQSDLTWEILNLFSLDPYFAFVGVGGSATESSDTLGHLLVVISSLTSSSPMTIRAQAAKTNLVLIDSLIGSAQLDVSMLSLTSNSASSLWQILIESSRNLLIAFHIGDPDDLVLTTGTFRETVLTMTRAVEALPEILGATSNAKAAVLLASVAVLTSLTGADVEQTNMTSPALLSLSRLSLIVNGLASGMTNGSTSFVEEIRSHSELLKELAKLPPATGRQQQQRAIRRVLKLHARPSTLLITVWLGLVARAKSLTSKIVSVDSDESSLDRDFRRRNLTADIEGLDEDESKEWQNLISFLCSTSNVCMHDSSPPPAITEVVGKGVLPRIYDEALDPHAAVESFLRECVDFLVSNSVHVRESMKEALGSDLPLSLCRVLVVQMTKLLSHSIGPSGIAASDAFTTFVEQAISVLRLSVDRALPGDNASGVQVDMGELLFIIAQYAHRLGRDDVATRIKGKFCQLIEAVLRKPEYVVLGNATRLRNALLEWMCEWSIESFRDEYHTQGYDKLQRDLDHACLRAMIPVTDGLVIRPAGDESGDTRTVVKSRLFYRYYNLLVKVIERATASENESALVPPSVSGLSLRANAVDSYPALAILVLSNLLSANVDVGLKHCLALGYHEDASIRTAFMQLLTNILQQGTRFGGLAAKGVTAAPKAYFDAVTAPNLALAMSICESCPSSELDEISVLLFRAFEARGNLLNLMKALIEREVLQTNHESELFRANSITTRLLTVFAKTYGYNYVRTTLQPLIHSLSEKPAECSFELDPSKATPSDDIERNADHLRLMCQALLDIICSSTPRVPVLFRALCHHIWEVVEDRFPDSRHSAVGSFIFLRFFCPAIVAPEGIDLDVSPDTREIRRALLLVTKVIQNLANNVVFGNKEAHMKVLNQFLSENIRQVTKFLSDVAIRPRSFEVAQATKIYQEESERSLDTDGDNTIIHRFVARYFTKVESSLVNMPPTFRPRPSSTRSSRPDLDGNGALISLRRLMDETGPPADTTRLSSSARSQVYDDFMRHNAGRNTESVASAFYEGPASQNGRRIFYFIVSRVALVDYDLLAYHVFAILDKVTDFFDLVIDLTDFSPSNELPSAWLRRSIQMCPPGILPCVNTLVLYNPNSYARRRLRRLISELSTIGPSVGKTVVAASSPAELSETIPFTSLALPEHTMALAYEADHVFTNLLCMSDHEMQVPVVVKLGHDCLQVASWRKQDLTGSLRAYIIDVINLKDVDDIISDNGPASDHLVVKHSQNQSVTFISRRRNEMAQIIRAARARLRDTPSEDRALRPSDVPGTLLNVAFLNLSSSDETLRMGAYSLVNELCQFFKYDLSSQVMKVSIGLVIPSNSLSFVYKLSKALATNAPSLTLEFLKEWTIGFGKADTPQKVACLHYVAPWLANLEQFAKPSRDDGVERIKQVADIIRSLISLTVVERRRLHLSLQEHVWGVIGTAHDALVDMVISELLHSAINAGLGSEKAETAADILVSLNSTAVKGKVVARLRKTIAQTYLKPTQSLCDSPSWNEICTLSRINLALSFSPETSVDTQLFLAELFHAVTLLIGSGPVLMRQTIYGLVVNILQSLATTTASGDMDSTSLQHLLLQLQQPDMIAAFGLVQSPGSLELSGLSQRDDSGISLLDSVEMTAKFLGEVLTAGAVSIDCANAWRARWMGLVAATCFQHNPATQPQAFTVLGYLASDEVDDDLVYQVLVALSTTLSHFKETDTILVISMLRCLARVIPGLVSESRYVSSLFWLAVAVLQLGYIPLFAPALELLLTALRGMDVAGCFATVGVFDALISSRNPVSDAARKLDQVCGVNFDTDPCFALVAIVYKGVRHPATRKLTIATLTELLKLASASTQSEMPSPSLSGSNPLITAKSVPFFIALLPIAAGSTSDLRALFNAAGVDVSDDDVRDVAALSIFDILTISDNSTALLVITFVVTILSSASTDLEKLVLYRFLADASAEIPDVVSMAYDSLIPRMTVVLTTTSSTAILSAVTVLLQRAMADPTYTFPVGSGVGSGVGGVGSSISAAAQLALDAKASLQHKKSYSGSISSVSPSVAGLGAREQVLEDLGMKGLGEMSFQSAKIDRLSSMAKWVSKIIESLTV